MSASSGPPSGLSDPALLVLLAGIWPNVSSSAHSEQHRFSSTIRITGVLLPQHSHTRQFPVSRRAASRFVGHSENSFRSVITSLFDRSSAHSLPAEASLWGFKRVQRGQLSRGRPVVHQPSGSGWRRYVKAGTAMLSGECDRPVSTVSSTHGRTPDRLLGRY